MTGAPVHEIRLTEYRVDTEPDHEAIGRAVDDELRRHFLGQTIVLRAISSAAHPGSAEELIETIGRLGTDRYDPERPGDRYDNVDGRPIDLFGFRRKVTPAMKLFREVSWGFFHGAIAIHGQPVRIDVLTVYESSALTSVAHRYQGRTDTKRDGFVFKDPSRKPQAVRAIFHLLDS